MSELKDTQNEADHRDVAIDRVGVKELRFPLQIRERGGDLQSTVATVSLAVDLPKEYKGTHMSRFVEVLNSHGSVLDIGDISKIPLELLERLNATRSHVEFRFPYFIKKAAPVSGQTGWIDYEVLFEIEAHDDGVDFTVTTFVPVATLCPCSKAISARGAHNQRGTVTFTTCAVAGEQPLWIEEMVAIVEASASCELYSVLKRPDEKEVTERAYDNPVFVEDLVRNIAVRAREEGRVASFRVEAENYESIHNHNAYAVVEQTG